MSNLYFFIKGHWIYGMTRHRAEPNINILLTRNLRFDTDTKQWSQPVMMPLHFLFVKLNNRTCGQFECFVAWFCFCFDFVHSHAQCSCCSIVCLRFQVVQIKQVDNKMSTKMWIIINKKHSMIFLYNCTYKSIKPQKSRLWGFR